MLFCFRLAPGFRLALLRGKTYCNVTCIATKDQLRDPPALHIAAGASPTALACAQQPGEAGHRARRHTPRQRRPLAAVADGLL